ncbi:MAG: hypothetical protein ACK5LL_16390 [Suipraeoptans sp.]
MFSNFLKKVNNDSNDEIINAINVMKQSNVFLGETSYAYKEKVVLVGVVNFAFFKYYNELYSSQSQLNFCWIRDRISYPNIFTYGQIFRIPNVVNRMHYNKLTIDCEVTSEEEEKINSNEHFIWAYKNIMQVFPQLNENAVKRVLLLTEKYFEKTFETIKPKAVMIWNPFVPFNKICEYVARSKRIPVVFAESGAYPGTFGFSTWGDLGESRPAKEYSSFLKLPIEDSEIDYAMETIKFLRDSKLNRNVQPINNSHNKLVRGIASKYPTVLYIGQNDSECGLVPYDSNAKLLHSPIFSSSHDALFFLAEIAKRNGWNLIYKPHPIAERRGLENVEIPSNVIYVAKGDVNAIIDQSDITITINSSTSYISLIRDTPIVLLGYTQLRGQGCAYEAYDKRNVELQMKAAIRDGLTKSQKKAFVEHTARMNKYCLFDSMQSRKTRYGQSIEEALEFVKSTINGKAEF